MTHEELLDKQVEALEKLLQLKQAVIEEQERKIQKLEAEKITIGSGTINIPSQWTYPTPHVTYTWQCSDGMPHNYPQMYGGTFPPCCTKCGLQAASQLGVYGGGAGGGSNISIQPNPLITTISGSQLVGGGAGGSNITYTTAYNGLPGQQNLPVHTTGYVETINSVTLDGISQTTSRLVPLPSAQNK